MCKVWSLLSRWSSLGSPWFLWLSWHDGFTCQRWNKVVNVWHSYSFLPLWWIWCWLGICFGTFTRWRLTCTDLYWGLRLYCKLVWCWNLDRWTCMGRLKWILAFLDQRVENLGRLSQYSWSCQTVPKLLSGKSSWCWPYGSNGLACKSTGFAWRMDDLQNSKDLSIWLAINHLWSTWQW